MPKTVGEQQLGKEGASHSSANELLHALQNTAVLANWLCR